jgi:diguanylate cyclase (GGDEF)-like protein
MLIDATILIQDVQLLCFTIVFGVLAAQRWSDRTRRWLWYSFLANTVGALCDLFASHLPTWITHGLNEEMIAFSYALINIAILSFDRRSRKAGWLSVLILLIALPIFLAWSSSPNHVRSDALSDLLIGLETIVTAALLFVSSERSTRAPRILMGGFLVFFSVLELARAWVAFVLHANPDVTPHGLEVTSVITYIVNISLLPLAFIWMMQSRLEWDLLQQSIVDSLTGVLNRRGLEQALDRELARSRRYNSDLTVALLDLDHFKRINDKHGHAVGDAILTDVARFLSQRIRKTDVAGRLGGEEFVLLLPHTDAGQSNLILEKLCKELHTSTNKLSAPSTITASIGVTTLHTRQGLSASALLHEADVALYQAKNNGRNQVRYFRPEE